MALGQQADRIKRVGVLMGLSDDDPGAQAPVTALRQALDELGWIEGRNIRFDIRWSGGEMGRLRALAAELVERVPDIIVSHSVPVTATLRQATQSIPIVFVAASDPVAQGFVSSMAHPGGNITGFSYLDYSVIGKSLELLKQLAPSVVRVAFMFNPDSYPYYDAYLPSLSDQVGRLSLDLTAARVHSDTEIGAILNKLASETGSSLWRHQTHS
jgi:putative ABC transport system substrate-binding protein